jgi:hypothetical protein
LFLRAPDVDEWASDPLEPAALAVIIRDPGGIPPMTITAAHITPLAALVAGILILIIPRLLNYVVAIYLILIGLIGLNNLHHFVR